MKIDYKVIDLNKMQQVAANSKKNGKTVGLCHGTFDLLHIGHIKHFYEAKSVCDILFVTLTPDIFVTKGPGRPIFNEHLRAEAIAALECVDFVALNNWPAAMELILKIKPDLYIKGKDYADSENDMSGNILMEKRAAESIGGALYLTSTEKFSSSNIINNNFSDLSDDQISFIENLKLNYGLKTFYDLMKESSNISVGVTGELIVDEYIFCETVGKSGKEPMLVNKVQKSQKFLGGVGGLSKILAEIVPSIDLITCIGEKEEEFGFIQQTLPSNCELSPIRKSSAPTIKKTRYINSYTNSKLIGFYDINDEILNEIDEREFQRILSSKLKNFDIVIEIDYGHGLISKSSQMLIRRHSKFLAVNSQINSFNARFHDLSRYRDVDLLCVNENEILNHFRVRSEHLPGLMCSLQEELNCKNLIVTRGANGSLGLGADNKLITCPSYARNVIDRVGAGDAYIGAAAIALRAGLPLAPAMFFASILAGKTVGTMGAEHSVKKQDLWRSVEALMK